MSTTYQSTPCWEVPAHGTLLVVPALLTERQLAAQWSPLRSVSQRRVWAPPQPSATTHERHPLLGFDTDAGDARHRRTVDDGCCTTVCGVAVMGVRRARLAEVSGCPQPQQLYQVWPGGSVHHRNTAICDRC